MAVTYFDRAAVQQALEAYVQVLASEHPEVEEVILFGSMACGTPVPGSDVDLLLVLGQSDRPFPERMAAYLPGRFPVAVDVFPYTREEFDRLEVEGGPAREAARHGVILFRRRPA